MVMSAGLLAGLWKYRAITTEAAPCGLPERGVAGAKAGDRARPAGEVVKWRERLGVGGISAAAVYLATVADRDHAHELGIVLELVDHPVRSAAS